MRFYSLASLIATDSLGLMMFSSDWSSTAGAVSGSSGCQTQLLLNAPQVLFIDSLKRKQTRSNGFISTEMEKASDLMPPNLHREPDKVSERERENVLSKIRKEKNVIHRIVWYTLRMWGFCLGVFSCLTLAKAVCLSVKKRGKEMGETLCNAWNMSRNVSCYLKDRFI